jgi:ATP-binding cassette subfamily B protein
LIIHAVCPQTTAVIRERVALYFAQIGRSLALVWRSSPGGTIAIAVLTVAAAAFPPAIAYVGKIIVDGVVAERGLATALQATRWPLTLWVAVEMGFLVASSLTERTLTLVRTVTGGRLGTDVNAMILDKALTLKLQHFEDSELYDKLTRARREASTRPLALMQATFDILRQAVSLAAYMALLVAFSPLLVVALLLATIPAFVVETRFSAIGFNMRKWRSPEGRRLSYLESVLTSDGHAKEVKVFGLGDSLRERYRVLAESFQEENRQLAVRRTYWGWGLSLISIAAFYTCYALIVAATVRGHLSLGDMTLYVVAFRQGQQSFQSALSGIAGMYEHALYMSNLFEYLNIPVDSEGRTAGMAGPIRLGERGIRFVNVGFRYPGASEWALHGLDVFIPSGQSLALVGENGAGKTTFVKLLTRLYEPTEGSVMLDGKDLRDWEESARRRRIGVIFQDFARYQFPLRDNIGLGSLEHLQDDARIYDAVERAAAREVVDRLPLGLDTQLGRWFEGGVELSGGEWQKVALSRAFIRTDADILVLDEPTASLDAEAEHAVFQRFRALAEGRTTIVVSHRFPTVRMADRILVLQAGRMIEHGTHAELLAMQGRYAHLFALQAQGYR